MQIHNGIQHSAIEKTLRQIQNSSHPTPPHLIHHPFPAFLPTPLRIAVNYRYRSIRSQIAGVGARQPRRHPCGFYSTTCVWLLFGCQQKSELFTDASPLAGARTATETDRSSRQAGQQTTRHDTATTRNEERRGEEMRARIRALKKGQAMIPTNHGVERGENGNTKPGSLTKTKYCTSPNADVPRAALPCCWSANHSAFGFPAEGASPFARPCSASCILRTLKVKTKHEARQNNKGKEAFYQVNSSSVEACYALS